jgi:acetolactate decarboxylase
VSSLLSGEIPAETNVIKIYHIRIANFASYLTFYKPMPLLPTLEISQELHAALLRRQNETKESLQQMIPRLLALELLDGDAGHYNDQNNGDEEHKMWQVSTTGALVRGIFTGECTVADVLKHGDFGVGTFEQLDGEMVILDGKAYQCRGDGSVVEPAPTAIVPFATVTYFHPDITHTITQPIDSFASLIRSIDEVRPHGNQYYGIKVTGTFKKMHVRMACKVKKGVGILEASHLQAEHEYENVAGTLVGFWSPQYTVAFSVPGLHAHWLSDDRKTGGHILDVVAEPGLTLQVHFEADFHCALPNDKAFNDADLPSDIAEALGEAEGAKH